MGDGSALTERATPLEQRGDTQRRLMQALLHQVAGLTVDELVEGLGITANAVRQHLTALEREAFVRFEARPAPRGRPQHVWRLTERGQEAFPRRYKELAEVVLAELGEHVQGAALNRAMRRMGARAAEASASGELPVAATARVMKQLGYEAAASGPNEIVARNCVFHQLARQFPAVCEFDLGFMESATGRKVEHGECMVRGGAVCRFKFGKRVT